MEMMNATRERKSPLRSSRYGNGRKSKQGTLTRSESTPPATTPQVDCATTKERFSRPAHDLIALVEEAALSIALRAETWPEANDIIHSLSFTIRRHRETAVKIHDGVLDVLADRRTWSEVRAELTASEPMLALSLAAAPRVRLNESEAAVHAALKTFIAEL